MSRRYAEVIGDPIAQSKSPAIHRFWIEKLGLDADYGSRQVITGQLGSYVDKARTNEGWQGCNVTMPHKRAVIELCDALDPLAARLGAVNTVARQADDLLKGFNTDARGFLEPLQAELEKPHLFRMARILGTGGAARAIIAVLADHGFTLVVAGRDPAKARTLLDELAPDGEHHVVDLAHFTNPTDFPFDEREGCLDLVVNASPLGMVGNPPLAFDWSHAPPGAIAYDIVTSPANTPFLKAARAAGHRTIGGLAMLVGQAAIAFEEFFGRPAPRQHDGELMELLTP